MFGGIQKNSLIDFPGKMSCVLFVSGCNFQCPYCHNPSLVNKNNLKSKSEKDIFDFLLKRKSFLNGVVISGGEPTINNDILYICEKIKEMGYPIKLDTNGSRPDKLKQLIDRKIIDYIAMDIKTDPLKYNKFLDTDCDPENINRSIKIIMESDLPYEFRTTCVKPIVNEDEIKKIVELIRNAKLYVLQKFNYSQLLKPEFLKGKSQIYNIEQLMRLKNLVEPFVYKCIVR